MFLSKLHKNNLQKTQNKRVKPISLAKVMLIFVLAGQMVLPSALMA